MHVLTIGKIKVNYLTNCCNICLITFKCKKKPLRVNMIVEPGIRRDSYCSKPVFNHRYSVNDRN